jgi:hypothetical protein
VYSFIRTDGKNTVLTILNFSGDKKSVKLELPKIFSSLKFTDPFTGKTVKYKNVESLKLPKFGYKLFVVE